MPRDRRVRDEIDNDPVMQKASIQLRRFAERSRALLEQTDREYAYFLELKEFLKSVPYYEIIIIKSEKQFKKFSDGLEQATIAYDKLHEVYSCVMTQPTPAEKQAQFKRKRKEIAQLTERLSLEITALHAANSSIPSATNNNVLTKALNTAVSELNKSRDATISWQIYNDISKEIVRINTSKKNAKYLAEDKLKTENKLLFLQILQRNVETHIRQLATKQDYNKSIDLIVQDAKTKELWAPNGRSVTFIQAAERRENHTRTWLNWSIFKPFKSKHSSTEKFVESLVRKAASI